MKIYKLKWTQNAKNDLFDIIEHIKNESPSNARTIYRRIREKAKSSNFFPLKGRVVPELQKEGIYLYRELLANPWRIVYKVDNNTVYISAILDSRQDIEDILLKKIME